MEEKNLTSWLKKTNGWQRFWVVYAILVVLYNLSIGASSYHSPLHMLVVTFLATVIPYALGIAISWIIKGFKG